MDNMLTTIAALIAATLMGAAPLIFAGLGGVYSEKSGVVNIGLDGMMIMGAFFAVLGTSRTNNPYIGVICAIVAGMAIAAIHAFLSIHLKADQIISGTAINLFSAALTSFLIMKLFGKGGQTDSVTKFPYNPSHFLTNIPYLGKIVSDINWFVVAALIMVFVTHFIINKTALGLRIRSVGEHPKAADTLGISVYGIRYLCVIISGALAGLGGAALSIGITPLYREGMVSGRGFIALAAMIFGNWKPIGTMWACFLFAFASSFQMLAQSFGWNLPSELYSSIPYILTMLALAGFVGKTTPPAADGQPYHKGEA
jgi:general nucleoside transport system permease protein